MSTKSIPWMEMRSQKSFIFFDVSFCRFLHRKYQGSFGVFCCPRNDCPEILTSKFQGCIPESSLPNHGNPEIGFLHIPCFLPCLNSGFERSLKQKRMSQVHDESIDGQAWSEDCSISSCSNVFVWNHTMIEYLSCPPCLFLDLFQCPR